MCRFGFEADTVTQNLRGVYFECTACDDYELCFKCYKAKDTVHSNHDFIDKGFDHDSDEEDSEEEDKSVTKESPTKPPAERGSEDGEHDGGFDDEVVSDDDD